MVEYFNAPLSSRAGRLDYHPGKEFALLPAEERNVDPSRESGGNRVYPAGGIG